VTHHSAKHPHRNGSASPANPAPEAQPPLACPDCGAPIAGRLRLAVESIRRAAKRPVTPEVLVVCSGCMSSFVVSLRPKPEKLP